MRALLLFWGIVVLGLACDVINRSPPSGFYQKEVVLSNYEEEGFLGKLNMYVPNRYDTLLDWVDEIYGGCCGSKKYRLLNRNNCLIKEESGSFYDEICRDTLDRLTIVYQRQGIWGVNHKISSTFLNALADNLERKIKAVWPNESVKWKAKKIIPIDSQPYLFLHFISRNQYSQVPVEQIYAGTFFNNTLILFIYENNQREHTEFIKEAYTSIRSIKLH